MSDSTYTPKTYRKNGGDAIVIASGGAILDERNTAKIYVDPEGSDTLGDGSLFSPVKTLTAAFALVTTARKTVYMRGGDYDEAAAVVWPSVNGVVLKGVEGDVVITSAASVTHVVGINPAAASGTWSATLDGVEIENGNGQVGLQVNNTNVGKRINLYLIDFTGSISGDTPGNSIDVDRSGGAGDAIRIYADGRGHTIEGAVVVINANTDDRFRFKGYRLIGGFTSSGANACEITFIDTGLLAAPTVNGAERLSNINCWLETDANPNVYTALTDHYHT